MPLKAPERNSEREPASTPLPETSTTTSSNLSSSERLATMKSPANEVPPADFTTASTSHPRGSVREVALLGDAVAQVDEHRLASGPETPSRLRRNEVTMISSAIAKVTTARPSVRRLTVGWSISSTQKQASTNTMNHGSVRGPEPQAADEHREEQRS